MKRLFALFVLVFLGLAAPVSGQTLDPDGLIRPELLSRATAALDEFDTPGVAGGKLVIVDYSLHSSQQRLFVVDLDTGGVTAFRAAHGLGSDPDHDGYLDSFSSVSGSQASPEGAFRLAEEYTGKHGRSFRLDGLDTTNQTARERAIVIHAALYAEPEFLQQHGKLGRSNGCIVFSKDDLVRFTETVPKGTLIFVAR